MLPAQSAQTGVAKLPSLIETDMPVSLSPTLSR